MPTFHYSAQSVQGKYDSGIITAASRVEAIHQLGDQRLTPVTLEVAGARSRWKRRVPQSAIANCFTGMADLLESGMPLLKTLDIVANQVANPRLQDALREVRDSVADGGTLAKAIESQPEVFSELSANMIAVGEEGGFLERSLQRVAKLTERQVELQGQILNAMAYPMFLLLAGIVVTTGMVVYFVPLFEPLFDRMSQRGELPWLTSSLLAVSGAVRELFVPLVLAIVVVIFLAKAWLSSASGKQTLDRWKLTAPGIGHIYRDLLIARFAHIMGTLLSNGVPMLKSLSMANKATGNHQLSTAISAASDAVAQGAPLAGPLARSGLFPTDVSETIAMGEHSNRLESVLLGLAERLERRVNKQLNLFTKLLEPMLMTVLAAMIGFLIIALLMPIFTSSGRF